MKSKRNSVKPVTRNTSRRPHGFIEVLDDSSKIFSPRRVGTSAVTGDQSLSTDIEMQSLSAFGNYRAINNLNS